MKVINPLVHAVLDYGLAALVLFAPGLFGFASSAAWTLAQATAVAYIVVSLLTRYPLGMVKAIPFPTHGVIESILAVAWIVAPWVLGFSGDTSARNFFVAAGIGLLAVVALTDYRAPERAEGSRTFTGSERRRGLADRRIQAMPVAADRRVSPRRRGSWAGA